MFRWIKPWYYIWPKIISEAINHGYNCEDVLIIITLLNLMLTGVALLTSRKNHYRPVTVNTNPFPAKHEDTRESFTIRHLKWTPHQSNCCLKQGVQYGFKNP